MAVSNTLFLTFFIPVTLTFLFSTHVTAEPASYSQRISPTSLGFPEEKLTHLHFFFHDVFSGPNRTVITVAEPLKGKSPLPFGTMVMIDDPLTMGPELGSKLVGRAQGFYMSSSQEEFEVEVGLIMAMTFAFTEGEYKGSTLSVLGRNMVYSAVREMPIIGGTGDFRFARGYVQAKTHTVDYTTGNAIVEYDVYVFHYLTAASSHKIFHDGIEFMIDPILANVNKD